MDPMLVVRRRTVDFDVARTLGDPEPHCTTGTNRWCRDSTLNVDPPEFPVDLLDSAKFHDKARLGNCQNNHLACPAESPEVLLQLLSAIEGHNYVRVAETLANANIHSYVNPSRGLLQVIDCRGAVAWQVGIDVAFLFAPPN
jgi:hypothetical protein